MIDPMQIPNTWYISEFAKYLAASLSKCSEDAEGLDTGLSSLKASWEGSGAEAYSQLLDRVLNANVMYREQREQVANMLNDAVEQLERAREQQNKAISLAEQAILFREEAAANAFNIEYAVALENMANEQDQQAEETQALAQEIVQGILTSWQNTLSKVISSENFPELGMGGDVGETGDAGPSGIASGFEPMKIEDKGKGLASPEVSGTSSSGRPGRNRLPPLEQQMKRIDPHFSGPYYEKIDGKTGGKRSWAKLSPSAASLGMGSDADPKLPGGIIQARKTYPKYNFKAGHLLNADLGGNGKIPDNLTILTAPANRSMTSFDNRIKAAIGVLKKLYGDLHKNGVDISKLDYGIIVEVSVSDGKWGSKVPDRYIANEVYASAKMDGTVPLLTSTTKRLHEQLLELIQEANESNTFNNERY